MSWISPDWPVPRNVSAVVTTRIGGESCDAYASLNLSDSVGDDPATVSANRTILADWLTLPQDPLWLQQVHGNRVVNAAEVSAGVAADASYADISGIVCSVTTADCLPVFFCDREGSRVAVAHAGWRGLAAGVLGAVVEVFGLAPEQLYVWLGPAIGPERFEVGEEVRSVFLKRQQSNISAFAPSPRGRWLADIYQLASNDLRAMGVENIFGGGLCTYTDAQRFYSYRRDRTTGRMASLIWME
ncbi:MAG: peptidoglycan editing factor PgeF [Gammaproteobacteria bacterium]|nr:peptidoglycan editing factor PgeF [Gammaproteobacteria bacterium]